MPLLYRLRASSIDKLKTNDIETAVSYATHSSGVLINVYSKSIALQQTENQVSLNIKQDKDGFDTVTGEVLLSTIGVEAGKIAKYCDKIIIEASYINPDHLAQKVFDKKKKTGDIYYKASRGSEPDLQAGIDNIITLICENGATIYNGSKNFITDPKENRININNNQLNLIMLIFHFQTDQ